MKVILDRNVIILIYLLNTLWVKGPSGTKSQSILKEPQSWEEMIRKKVVGIESGAAGAQIPKQ